jgi:hypothetical protein
MYRKVQQQQKEPIQKWSKEAGSQWLTPAILATQEIMRRIMV